ncbi:VOC family protein [Shinella sp. BYT-45]|uniref:VOC family protein n=1 Tax=Shinella sp. BYT-45 TaxID=3377377 RepID=UPI00397F6333
MVSSITPCLMFEGRAEEAMTFYVGLFPESRIEEMERYGPGEAGREGSVRRARFSLGRQSVMCIDSPVSHAFSFTPSFSFFVECESETRIRELHAVLGDGGGELMPLDDYGFSRAFAWLNDRFGVSWQLNLA